MPVQCLLPNVSKMQLTSCDPGGPLSGPFHSFHTHWSIIRAAGTPVQSKPNQTAIRFQNWEPGAGKESPMFLISVPRPPNGGRNCTESSKQDKTGSHSIKSNHCMSLCTNHTENKVQLQGHLTFTFSTSVQSESKCCFDFAASVGHSVVQCWETKWVQCLLVNRDRWFQGINWQN